MIKTIDELVKTYNNYYRKMTRCNLLFLLLSFSLYSTFYPTTSTTYSTFHPYSYSMQSIIVNQSSSLFSSMNQYHHNYHIPSSHFTMVNKTTKRQKQKNIKLKCYKDWLNKCVRDYLSSYQLIHIEKQMKMKKCNQQHQPNSKKRGIECRIYDHQHLESSIGQRYHHHHHHHHQQQQQELQYHNQTEANIIAQCEFITVFNDCLLNGWTRQCRIKKIKRFQKLIIRDYYYYYYKQKEEKNNDNNNNNSNSNSNINNITSTKQLLLLFKTMDACEKINKNIYCKQSLVEKEAKELLIDYCTEFEKLKSLKENKKNY